MTATRHDLTHWHAALHHITGDMARSFGSYEMDEAKLSNWITTLTEIVTEMRKHEVSDY